MASIKQEHGQFIPISAMVMFTIVVFMIGLVNVYIVTRAKLKAQNLADAIATNLATQQAQAYNMVADKNEWLNRMVAGLPSASDNGGDCSLFTARNRTAIPGISCVENTEQNVRNVASLSRRHIFQSRDGAINYAMVVRTVNKAQMKFLQAYNDFIGANAATSSGINGGTTVEELLERDIPELSDDPSIHVFIWNHDKGFDPDEVRELSKGAAKVKRKMQGIDFAVDHDIRVAYNTQGGHGPMSMTFKDLLYGRINYDPGNSQYGRNGPLRGVETPEDVGWLVPDPKMPKIPLDRPGSQEKVGVGVTVSKEVNLGPLGKKLVTATSRAYLVEEGHELKKTGSGSVPIFKPTFWVKLAN
jgi:hypothetical protein